MVVPRRVRSGRRGRRRRALVRGVVLLSLAASHLRPRRLQAAGNRLGAGAWPAPYDVVERLYGEVVRASPRCAGWRGCLPRSIAVALLCRVEGSWPEWCVGVRASPPFAAHAWLEVEAQVVGEPGTPADYRPLLRVGPRATAT